MSNPFILKLEHGARLSDDDRVKLAEITSRPQSVGAREDLIREGDRPDDVRLVMDGLACRYKLLRDGARQICGYMVPGDMCDMHVTILGEMDHSIATLSPCAIVDIPRSTIEDLAENHPRIARALWWSTLVDEGILREWLVGMGRRPADMQMAHLFCELLYRLRAAGRATQNVFELPLTQAELGDTLGLSVVHVNRVLQSLRDDGLISFRRRKLAILDLTRLQAFADFTPNYLHLSRSWDRGQPSARPPPLVASGVAANGAGELES